MVGSYVALGDQIGIISRLDGAKCAVSILPKGGPTKWRTLADVRSVFGSSGTPKAVLAVADFVRLAPKAGAEVVVGQILKIEGGRMNVRCAQDGKVLWRNRADLTPPFDDAPQLPILGEPGAAAKPSSELGGGGPTGGTPPRPSQAASKPPAPPAPPMADPPAGAEPGRLRASRSSVGGARLPLVVQTSGVGGGDDISLDPAAFLACATVGGLKHALRQERSAWAELELRLLIDGVVMGDDNAPVDPAWCPEAASMAGTVTVVCMALRKRAADGPATATATAAPAAAPATAPATAPALAATGGGPGGGEGTTPRGTSVASRIAAQRQQRAQERAESRQATPRGTPRGAEKPLVLGGGGERCHACGKTCFVAERAPSTPHNLVLHRACFCCATCGKTLAGGGFELAVNDTGVETFYCPPHARQRRAEAGNAQEVSANAAAATLAGATVTTDSPPCAMCGRPVAKHEQWDASLVSVRLEAHPRWRRASRAPEAGAPLVFHIGCAGCFKCAAKGALEVDHIGGIYCNTHYTQRVQAAGGPVRASDAAALQATEAIFVRPGLQPPPFASS